MFIQLVTDRFASMVVQNDCRLEQTLTKSLQLLKQALPHGEKLDPMHNRNINVFSSGDSEKFQKSQVHAYKSGAFSAAVLFKAKLGVDPRQGTETKIAPVDRFVVVSVGRDKSHCICQLIKEAVKLQNVQGFDMTNQFSSLSCCQESKQFRLKKIQCWKSDLESTGSVLIQCNELMASETFFGWGHVQEIEMIESAIPEALGDFIALTKSLRSVRLSRCTVKQDVLKLVLSTLSSSRNLRSLDLSWQDLRGCFEDLLMTIGSKQWPDIIRLNLAGTKISFTDVSELKNVKHGLNHLTQLILADNDIPFLPRNLFENKGPSSNSNDSQWSSLELLDIQRTGTSEHDLRRLCEANEQNDLPALVELKLTVPAAQKGSISLLTNSSWPKLVKLWTGRELDWSQTDKLNLILAIHKGQLPKIQHVDNFGPQVMSDCVFSLIKDGKLDLEEEDINKTDICTILVETSVHVGNLHSMQFPKGINGGCLALFCELLGGKMAKLQELFLPEVGLTEQDITGFAEAACAGKFANLKKINFSDNQITGHLRSVLLPNGFPSLEHLLLQNTMLNKDDIDALTNALAKGKLPNLEALSLSDNNLKGMIPSLFEKGLYGLKRLCLERTQMSKVDAHHLGDIFNAADFFQWEMFSLSTQLGDDMSLLFIQVTNGQPSFGLSLDVQNASLLPRHLVALEEALFVTNDQSDVNTSFLTVCDLSLGRFQLKITDSKVLKNAKIDGNFTKLRVINLSNSVLTGKLKLIFQTRFPFLEFLRLENTKLNWADVDTIGTALDEGKLLKLSALSLNQNVLTETINWLFKTRYLFEVKNLFLEDTYLVAKDIDSLQQTLATSAHKLERLDLSNNNLAHLLPLLVQHPLDSLQVLNLDETSLTLEDISALGEAAEKNMFPVLRWLSLTLSGNHTDCIGRFLEGPKKMWPRLETLALETEEPNSLDIAKWILAILKGKLPRLASLWLGKHILISFWSPNILRGLLSLLITDGQLDLDVTGLDAADAEMVMAAAKPLLAELQASPVAGDVETTRL